MGWDWLEGDTDVPELTERENFREVLLKGRLAAALRKINLRDGQPWLDEGRIARAVRNLEQAAGHRLMEVNQSATELLLKGTVADGLAGWEQGRPQPVRFIDFKNPANNDFLIVNQFKVELTSGRGHVIPDAVLFVNGIPLVVAEFKSPGIQSPLQEAINHLLRYSNQRRELFPTLYTESEGVERLFHTNQPLIASDYVIVHELGHLLEPHYGPAFSNVLDRCMPDWRNRKEDLKTQAQEIYWCQSMAFG
jgi:type I restriction enzyme, R subunit